MSNKVVNRLNCEKCITEVIALSFSIIGKKKKKLFTEEYWAEIKVCKIGNVILFRFVDSKIMWKSTYFIV